MFHSNNLKMNVNMTGKEYIEYKRSIKARPMSKRQREALAYFIMSVIGIIFLAFLLDDLTYMEPVKTYSLIHGLVIDNALISLISFCAGIAWIIHGFGFYIIKR